MKQRQIATVGGAVLFAVIAIGLPLTMAARRQGAGAPADATAVAGVTPSPAGDVAPDAVPPGEPGDRRPLVEPPAGEPAPAKRRPAGDAPRGEGEPEAGPAKRGPRPAEGGAEQTPPREGRAGAGPAERPSGEPRGPGAGDGRGAPGGPGGPGGPDGQARRQPPTMEERLKAMAQAMGLTEAQTKQIKPILEASSKQTRAVMTDEKLTPEQRREKTRAIRADTREKVEAILTPEQKQRYEAMRSRSRRPPGQGDGPAKSSAGAPAGAPAEAPQGR